VFRDGEPVATSRVTDAPAQKYGAEDLLPEISLERVCETNDGTRRE